MRSDERVSAMSGEKTLGIEVDDAVEISEQTEI